MKVKRGWSVLLGTVKSNVPPFCGRRFEVRVKWPLIEGNWRRGFSVNEANFPNFAVQWGGYLYLYIALTPGLRWSRFWHRKTA